MKKENILNMTEGNPTKLLAVFFLPMLIMLIPGSDIMSIWWTVGFTWALSALFCCMRYVFWKRKQKD